MFAPAKPFLIWQIIESKGSKDADKLEFVTDFVLDTPQLVCEP